MPSLEGVMEGGGIGKSQGVGGFGGGGLRSQQKAAREITARLFDQEPMRRGLLAQFSLQRAAADSQVTGRVLQAKISAAQALANEAEETLR
jgi:hypothetical protein